MRFFGGNTMGHEKKQGFWRKVSLNQLKLIPDILVRLGKTEEEVKYSSEKITEINVNLLMNEEKITTYEGKIEKR